jgi:2-iminobutanoate/2-iminopropanoate deaminase
MSSEIKVISTPNAPAAKGPYSQGFVHDGMVYVAGQLPLDPATGEVVPGTFQDHVKQALRNVEAILKAGGSDLEHVVRINVYLTDESQFPLLNEAYVQVMKAPYPPRTARAVALGPYDVEIDAQGVVVE